jgi:hypothetical protein
MRATKDGNFAVTSTNVVSFHAGNPRIERIRAEINAGMARLSTGVGRSEWTEGSLQIAAALREAKSMVPTGTAEKEWFQEHHLDYFPANERIALVGLAGNIEVARELLNRVERRSYQNIWNQHRHLFVPDAPKPKQKPEPEPKPEPDKAKRKQYAPRSRAMIHFTLKLGEQTIAKIRGTSLDSAKEMEELLMLNRGAEEGTLNPIVQQLVDDAAAGKEVSALAVSARQFGVLPKRVVKDLQMAWTKRMTHPWQLAGLQEKADLLVHVIMAMPKTEREEIVEYVLDHVNLKEEGP